MRYTCSSLASLAFSTFPQAWLSQGRVVTTTGKPAKHVRNKFRNTRKIHPSFPKHGSHVFCFKSFTKHSRFPTQMTLFFPTHQMKANPKFPTQNGQKTSLDSRRSLMPYWKSSMKRWKSLGSATPNNATLHLGSWVNPVIWDPFWKGGEVKLDTSIWGHFSRGFPVKLFYNAWSLGWQYIMTLDVVSCSLSGVIFVTESDYHPIPNGMKITVEKNMPFIDFSQRPNKQI